MEDMNKMLQDLLGEAPDNIVVLNDENGNEVEFEFLDLMEYNGSEYVILLPRDDGDGEVVILKVLAGESGEEESYVSVDDAETLDAVFQLFKEKFKDDFNFVD